MTVGDPKFDALRNSMYHQSRQRALDWINKLFNLALIMLGASVASEFLDLSLNHERATIVGLTTTFIATLQLVYDPGGRARIHEALQRRFYELLAEMESAPIPGDDQAKLEGKWEAALIRIYADQPPTMRALDAVAYNEAADAMGAEWKERLHVGFLEACLRHVFAFNSHHFQSEEERVSTDTKRKPRWARSD